MILTRKEKDHIKIWRLLEEISVKQGEGYYSLDATPNQVNTRYYLPTVSHCEFGSSKETIESLKNLLKMSKYEYKLDFEGMVKKLAELRTKRKETRTELDELEEVYTDAVKQLNNR